MLSHTDALISTAYLNSNWSRTGSAAVCGHFGLWSLRSLVTSDL